MHGLAEMLEKRKEKSRRGALALKLRSPANQRRAESPGIHGCATLRAWVLVFSQPHLVDKKEKVYKGLVGSGT